MIDLLIIGAGLSGLQAALCAAERGVERVLLIDSRSRAGGFTSPYQDDGAFAAERQLLERASGLPYPVWTKATVVGLFPGEGEAPHLLYVQRADSTETITARCVLIASGSMEKPREAHRIPGSRPAGVLTPYLAMELLQRGKLPGLRLLSIGDTRMHRVTEDRLRAAGCQVEAYDHRRVEVRRILGESRLSGVLLYEPGTGQEREWSGDTLLYARDRIPCTFFLKGTRVKRDAHGAVEVEADGRTNVPRIYAAGSCTTLGDDDHRHSMTLALEGLGNLWKEAGL